MVHGEELKSTTTFQSMIMVLWFALTQTRANSGLASSKRLISRLMEDMTSLALILQEISLFWQVGFLSWSSYKIVIDKDFGIESQLVTKIVIAWSLVEQEQLMTKTKLGLSVAMLMLSLRLWSSRDTKCLWSRTLGAISATMGSLVSTIREAGPQSSNKLSASTTWKQKTTESFGWTSTHSVITMNASTSTGTHSFSHTARASSICGK